MEAAQQSPQSIEDELNRKGHVVTSWDQLGEVVIEATGVETSSYRIGLPSLDSSPWFYYNTFYFK